MSDRRQVQICKAHAPLCPACRKPIRQVHVLAGSFLGTCEQTPALELRGQEGVPRRCSQHFHVVGSGDLCLVVAVDRVEFEEIRGGGLSPRLVYERFGLLEQLLTRAGVA